MTAIHYDTRLNEAEMRHALYQGDLFVFSPTDAQQRLVAHAKMFATEAFNGHCPVTAHKHFPVDEYVTILAELKPRFIHDPLSKTLIREILLNLGCSPHDTYFDVPRLRTATPTSYLSSGMAYAFKPHRDTWYSPPMCQLNWWLPVFPMQTTNTMAFHPYYWDRPLKNSSDEFNYQDWQEGGRKDAVHQINKDTRRQSAALEPVELEPQIRLVPSPGSMIVFSAAHMHSTVPNTTEETRISIDFRTVNLADIENDTGAANQDSRSHGTTTGDYLNLDDYKHLPQALIESHRRNGSTPPPVGKRELTGTEDGSAQENQQLSR